MSENAITITHQEHYDISDALGLDYGPSFRAVDTVCADGDTATVSFRTPDAVKQGLHRFVLHPSFLDGCLQSLFSLVYASGERSPDAYLPYQINRLKVFRARSEVATCRTVLRKRMEKSLVADFQLFDHDGHCIAEATGVRFVHAELQTHKDSGTRFRFETVPLSYVDAKDTRPKAAQIADAIGLANR